jgi:Tat protein translocase TatB subunit
MYMLSLILMLTFAHAVFMVSAAIVISIQATTIRAASLLASFVIVPVAFLLQAETILIFWGNEDILWLVIVAVVLLSVLLVRLGLAHFRREYLLGREIDTINFRWTWKKFLERFRGSAKSIPDWYRHEIPETLRQLRKPLTIVLVLAVVAGIASYVWVVRYVPAHLNLTPERVTIIRTFVADNLTDLDEMSQRLPAPILFLHNTRTTVVFLLLGLASFSTLGLALFMGNIGLVGGVMGAASLVGYSPLLTFVAGVLPHGIFELTAVFLATAAMFDIGLSEMMIIAVVALVVLGPERLPRVARQAGQWLGKLRRYVDDVKADINRQMELDELRKLQAEVKDAAREIEASVQSTVSAARGELEQVKNSFEGAAVPAEPKTDWDSIYAVRRQRDRIKDRRIEREKELGIKRPKRPLHR